MRRKSTGDCVFRGEHGDVDVDLITSDQSIVSFVCLFQASNDVWERTDGSLDRRSSPLARRAADRLVGFRGSDVNRSGQNLPFLFSQSEFLAEYRDDERN